jgi:hypothetical protein
MIFDSNREGKEDMKRGESKIDPRRVTGLRERTCWKGQRNEKKGIEKDSRRFLY